MVLKLVQNQESENRLQWPHKNNDLKRIAPVLAANSLTLDKSI